MNQAVRWAALAMALLLIIYLGIAFFFIFTSKPERSDSPGLTDFWSLLAVDYSDLPLLQQFTAKDNGRLSYRHYPAKTPKTLILIHGSSYHRRNLHDLARSISSKNLTQVVTPNLRGHFRSGYPRGNVLYIGQLEDDLADLIGLIKKKRPDAKIIVGGHSAGGGLAARFEGGKHGKLADAYLLLAPYLQYDAPTTRPNSGGWAMPYIGRIIGLTMLNRIGFRFFNNMIVIKFNLKRSARDGTETLHYSYALNTSLHSRRNYRGDLWKITQPFLVLVGREDEVFIADEYPKVLAGHPTAQIRILPGVKHLDILVDDKTKAAVEEWLNGL